MIRVSRGVGRAPGVLALAALALSGCGGAGTSGNGVGAVDAAPSVSATTTASAEGLPAHWRWESYGAVEIGVPADWGYETAERPWCIKSSTEGPFVGRPGGVPLIGCSLGDDDGADPATVLSSGGTFVWFTTPSPRSGAKAGTARDPVHSGDRDTVVVAGVHVAVQAPAALRRQILSTLRVVDQRDHNSCPIASPFEGNPRWRPDGPAVATLTEVRAVSACAYAGARLTSSLRLQDKPAAAAIAAVAAAPIGGGPNLPASSCTSDDPVRDDIIVLQVSSGHGESKIVLRYGGCFHRGLDDGTAVRTLTRPAVLPFVAGPNRVTGFTGEALTDILMD